MKLVYDMVNGEFIEEEYKPVDNTRPAYEFDSNDSYAFETALRLQPVAFESETLNVSTNREITLPADLALQTFLTTK